MIMTKEMIKKIANEVMQNEKILIKKCEKDVKKICQDYQEDDYNDRNLFEGCEDGLEFERNVEYDIDEYVKERTAEYSDNADNFIYEIAKKVLNKEGKNINDYEYGWDEVEAIIQEMKFKKVNSDETFTFDNFAEMVYDLGNKGFFIPDLSEEWKEYEEDKKAFSRYNGSGWSPSW